MLLKEVKIQDVAAAVVITAVITAAVITAVAAVVAAVTVDVVNAVWLLPSLLGCCH